MALYHAGAFAGSLHGSTKNTTFRRSKGGNIVAYDRVDPHSITRANKVKASTPATFAMYAAVHLSGMLGIIPSNAYAGGKYSSQYNEFVGALSKAIAQWLLDPSCPFYNNISDEAFHSYFTSLMEDEGASVYELATSMLYTLVSKGLFEWTHGTGKAIVVLGGTKAAQTVTVEVFDGKSHKVDVILVSLVKPGVIQRGGGVSDGLTPTTINVNAALVQSTYAKTSWYNKFPALTIVSIDGKPVNATTSVVEFDYPNE